MILLITFALLAGFAQAQDIVPVRCVTREGPAAIGIGAISSQSCNAGETLVSCGLRGTQAIGGTYIDPNNNNECTVISNHNGWHVFAEAVCCRFPAGSVVSMTTVTGPKGAASSVICADNTELTGCQVKYVRGDLNEIKGAFTGPATATPQVTQWIDTANRCNAYAKDGSSIVQSGAQCIKFTPGYTLECQTKAAYVNLANFGGCPVGHNMMACNAYTTTRSLDSYYRNNEGKCYVQQDNHVAQYANAVCCRFRQVCSEQAVAFGDLCRNDNECPSCMKCCRGTNTCHWIPEYTPV